MTALLLLLLLAFCCWACGHVNARIHWYQDERDADQFVDDLQAAP